MNHVIDTLKQATYSPASLHTWLAFAHIHQGIFSSILLPARSANCLVGPCTSSLLFRFHVSLCRVCPIGEPMI